MRPDPQSILESYSMEELLELVKDKADAQANERLEEARRALDQITGGYAPPAPAPKYAPPVYDEPEEPAPLPIPKRIPAAAPKEPPARRGRKRGQMSLGDHVQQVVGKKPMKVEEIINAIQKNGYSTKSKNLKGMLYTELGKQVKRGDLKNTGRGEYAKP